jgi:hypothetical protein
MSIYLVKLSEWYPLGDEQHDTLISILSLFRCPACRKKCRFSKAVGLHSIPWGHGEPYCGWKCAESGKIAKPDKRRRRRMVRRFKDIEENFLVIKWS